MMFNFSMLVHVTVIHVYHVKCERIINGINPLFSVIKGNLNGINPLFSVFNGGLNGINPLFSVIKGDLNGVKGMIQI